ncbi:hypothetical protein GCM10009605_25850 [Nocardiopsis composta]
MTPFWNHPDSTIRRALSRIVGSGTVLLPARLPPAAGCAIPDNTNPLRPAGALRPRSGPLCRPSRGAVNLFAGTGR